MNNLIATQVKNPEAYQEASNLLVDALRYTLTVTGINKPLHSVTEYITNVESVVWLILMPEDVSSNIFWGHLCLAFSTWSTKLVSQLQAMGFPSADRDREQVETLLLQAQMEQGNPVIIIRHPRYFTISPVRDFVAELIEHTYAQLPYIIFGREAWIAQLPDAPEPICLTFRDLTCSRNTLDIILHNWLHAAPSPEQLNRIHEATGGWAPSVYFLGTQIRRGLPVGEQEIDDAITSINDVIDREFFRDLESSTQHSLLLLSLLDNFSAELVACLTSITKEDFASLTKQIPFFRYDSTSDFFTIQTIFRNYLATQMWRVSSSEIHEFLIRSGEWYASKGCPTEPLALYLEAADYDRAARFLSGLDLFSVPQDICVRYDTLMNRIPPAYLEQNPMLYVYRILLCYRTGKVRKGKTELHHLIATISSRKEHGSGDSTVLGECYILNALINWSLGREFSFDLEQAGKYLPHGSKLFADRLCDFMGSTSALPLGGSLTMDGIVDQYHRAEPHMKIALLNNGRGVEYLAECEVCFYRGDFENALLFADKAIQTAVECRQWNIASLSSFMGLRSNMMRGRWDEVDTYMQICQSYSNRDNSEKNRPVPMAHIASATVRGFLKIQGRADSFARNMVSSKSPDTEAPITVREMIQQYMAGNYRSYESLALIDTMIANCKLHTQWITKLYMMIFRSLLYLELEQLQKATEHLEDCYLMSRDERVITPFIEFGADMVKMVRFIRRRPSHHAIPAAWLSEVEQRAAEFEEMKKMRTEYLDNFISIPDILLTRRERQAYSLLCTGMKMAQIAQEMGASVSTVKVTLSHVYKKLGVKNKKEAIQLARKT